MKKIDENIKTISTRSTWMLGAVITIMLSLAAFIFGTSNGADKITEIIATTIFFTNLIIIALNTKSLIEPKFGSYAYDEPKNLRKNDSSMQNIIEKETNRLEKVMEQDEKKLEKLLNRFNTFVYGIILTPFIASALIAILTVLPN